MNPITIPNISIPTIGIPTIGIPSVGFPSASGGGGLSWPAGMKEHIKAWYDPKKQGMTNFDVIESYADDFTKWRIENTGVTSTQKKIVIAAGTELKYNVAYKGFGNSIAEFDIKYTGNAVIRYQYNKEDGTTGIITINRSGIYHLPASIKAQKNFGFYCNSQTVTEEATIEQLPTSILKDFSGNGNHAYLYGGKGKLNSGMGVYGIDVTENIIQQNRFEYLYDNITKEVTFIKALSAGSYLFTINKNIVNSTQQIKFEGIDSPIRFINSTTNETYYNITEDGIYDIEFVTDANTIISTNYTTNQELNLKVQFLPYYPDQLCYDGKMYAVAYDMPILTDYTVMAERTWFENRNIFLAKGNITTEAKYAFIFERFKPDGVMAVQSFGAWNDVVSTTDSCISYLTKNKYNGIDIRSGIGADDDMLSIGGALNKGNIELTSVCCHGAIIVADRSFTEEEINWLKQNWDKI
jgi:hypothetical protein